MNNRFLEGSGPGRGGPWRGFTGPVGLGVVLVVVALSRFAFLPEGPWEQDEALLAAGVVDFDPGHHMPHPPGFPLWVWIGRLVMGLGVRDPLRALQLASAGFSVLGAAGVWALTRKLVAAELALPAALLSAFLPGVWFHAARGFSETPSAVVFLLAVVLWVRDGERNFFAGTLLLAAAALIRPPLAPFFLVAALLWVYQARPGPRTLLVAAATSAALVLATLAPLVLEAGGLAPYWESFATHAGEHAALLGSEGADLATLGWVRGLGGPVPAAAFTVLVAVGWLLSLREAGFWPWARASFLGLWLVYLLVFTHNRTYPRYWVLPFLLAPVLVARALAWILRWRLLAAAVVGATAGVSALWTYPAVAYVHCHPLPAVEAFLAAKDPNATVVFQDELFSFCNYLVRANRLRVATLRFSEVKPPRYKLGGSKLFLVAETSPTFLPSSVSAVRSLRVEETKVAALSQGRFLTADLVANPVVLVSGGSIREFGDEHPFVWLYPDATLLLPAVSGSGAVTFAVELPPGVGESVLEAWTGGSFSSRANVRAGRSLVSFPLDVPEARRLAAQVVPLRLKSSAMRRLAGDLRPLALKVSFVSLEAPPWNPLPYSVVPEPVALHRAAVEAEGIYGPEKFPVPVPASSSKPPAPSTASASRGEAFTLTPGAWCGPRCLFRMAVGEGRVGLWLSAPRPGGVRLTAALGGNRVEAQLTQELAYLELPVPPGVKGGQRLELVLEAPPYEPPNDPRVLGVVVHRLGFSPWAVVEGSTDDVSGLPRAIR
ncbi:MAG: hypothetical protein ACP5NF_02555 [Thermoanaerobaculum sp.]